MSPSKAVVGDWDEVLGPLLWARSASPQMGDFLKKDFMCLSLEKGEVRERNINV